MKFAGTLLSTCFLACACTTSTPFDKPNFSVDLGYGVKMDFISIPAGTFRMERAATSVEVEISSFALGKTEVTRAQWLAVMGTIHPSPWENENHPIEKISWDEAMQFCEKLTRQERLAGRLPLNLKFTLPTEAQWEYACRAGSRTRFSFGDLVPAHPRYRQFENFKDKSFYNEPGLRDIDPCFEMGGMSRNELIEYVKRYDDGFVAEAPVGSFHSNAWGLYDMHGNVAEWCLDYYYHDLLGGKDPVRTSPEPNGDYATERIVLGGDWATPFFFGCEYSFRRSWSPAERYPFIGFRVALVQSSNP